MFIDFVLWDYYLANPFLTCVIVGLVAGLITATGVSLMIIARSILPSIDREPELSDYSSTLFRPSSFGSRYGRPH